MAETSLKSREVSRYFTRVKFMLTGVRSKLRDNRIIVLLIVVAAGLAYLPTVQPDISAANNTLFTDVGNVQNGLAQWGTLHSTAYPLFSFLGAVFVWLLKLIGIAPAMGASLFSTVWAIAALVMFYLLIDYWLADRVVALAATAVLGAGWAYWLFAAYAEVYSLSTFVAVAAFFFALKADRTREIGYLYGLAVCCGMVVAHHRAIALALPAPLLIALPAFWDTVRHRKSFFIKWIALAVSVGLGAYLYLLVRSLMHASWMWGDPSTPAGFWGLMSGGTYLRFFAWPTTLNGWLDIIGQVGQPWIEMITWPMAVLGTAGLIVMLVRRQFRYALGLIFVGVTCFLFAIAVQGSFPGQKIEDVPALLQPTVIVALLGFAFLCHILGQRSIWLARGGVGVALSVSVVLGVQNQPLISQLTHDTTGRDIISAAQNFVADAKLTTPAGFFAPWGGEFWALAYGQDVEQSIPKFELLPNRAKLAEALNQYGVLYTFEHTLFTYDLAWWKKHLGNPAKVYLSSAGDDVIAIATHPLLSESDLADKTQTPAAMGASILLRSWTITSIHDRTWLVTLYWEALTQPDRDYSVFVHASDQASIDSPEAIVAQADTNAPVYGWYPTTMWSPGEIIRDDHIITAPADRRPTLAAVGLYYQDETGAFHNLGQKIIPIIP